MIGVRIRRQIGQAVLLLAVLFAAGIYPAYLLRPRIEIQLKTPEGKPLADVELVVERLARAPGSPPESGLSRIAWESARTDRRGIARVVRNPRTQFMQINQREWKLYFRRGQENWSSSDFFAVPLAGESRVAVEALSDIVEAKIVLLGATPIVTGQQRILQLIVDGRVTRHAISRGESFELRLPAGYKGLMRVATSHRELWDLYELDRTAEVQFPTTPGPVTIPFEMNTRTQFRGVLLGPSGKPLEGLRVMVRSAADASTGAENPNLAISNLTGPDGGWEVWVPSDDYYAVNVVSADGLVRVILHPTNAPAGVAYEDWVVPEFQPAETISFSEPLKHVMKPAVALSATVQNESGVPVPNVAIYTYMHVRDWDDVPPRSNVDGEGVVFLPNPTTTNTLEIICAQTERTFGVAVVSADDPKPFEIVMRNRVEVVVPKPDPADQIAIILLPDLPIPARNVISERNYSRLGFRVLESPGKGTVSVAGIPAGDSAIVLFEWGENRARIAKKIYIVDAAGKLVERPIPVAETPRK